MKTLVPDKLTPEAFAAFGDVVSAGLRLGTSANQGTATRFDWSAQLLNLREGAKPNLAVFRASPQRLPFTVKLLERHPYSSQAFLPLICSRYLVCVAPARADGAPDLLGLRAFVCERGMGINYHAGNWHHPMVALDEAAEFAMLAWEDGTKGDCEEQALAEPLLVSEGR